MQTLMVAPPLMNMTSSTAPESKNHTPVQIPIYKQIGGRPMEEPWQNWHMPEEASGTEVVAAAQLQGQQHLLCPLPSVVVAETHQADLMLLVALSRWGSW